MTDITTRFFWSAVFTAGVIGIVAGAWAIKEAGIEAAVTIIIVGMAYAAYQSFKDRFWFNG